MNVIFGSGVVALLARRMLAGDWTIVPFKRSRFYTLKVPFGDNVVVRDAGIDGFMASLGAPVAGLFYKRSYSLNGQLITTFSEEVCRAWLDKVFVSDVPSQAVPYWRNRMISPIYPVRITNLYHKLSGIYLDHIGEQVKLGDVTAVGDHYFVRNGVRYDFNEAISTIPFNDLASLIGVSVVAPTRTIHCTHVISKSIDLEACNQAFVVDNLIDFYKVVNIAPGHYLFFSTRGPITGGYLLPIIGQAEVIDGTGIRDALPAGEMPDLGVFEKLGIYCVGSGAQHDWCMDVGSCMLRLVRYCDRGHKPKQSQSIPIS